MEVVEKIDNFQSYDVGCGVSIYKGFIRLGYNSKNKKFETIQRGKKIEAVYNGCVKFIEWYNKEIK